MVERNVRREGKTFMGHVARVSSKGQIVIPANRRKELGLNAGTRVDVVRNGDGLTISPRGNMDAVLALCGKYAGFDLEKDLIEEKRLEREREDRKLDAY